MWEETIILLPDNVHYVFLSATIPNARQFAEWIAHLHKQVWCTYFLARNIFLLCATAQTGSRGKELTNQNISWEQRIAIFFLTKPITLKNANNSSITNWTLNKSMKCCRLIILYPHHWFWFSCCKMRFQAKFLEWNLSFGYFAVMDWSWTVHVLVHVLVRTLAWVTALCSYARHFTFKVPLPTKVYKWLLENLIGDNHAMD